MLCEDWPCWFLLPSSVSLSIFLDAQKGPTLNNNSSPTVFLTCRIVTFWFATNDTIPWTTSDQGAELPRKKTNFRHGQSQVVGWDFGIRPKASTRLTVMGMARNQSTRNWTASVSPCFHVPGFRFGHLCLTHSALFLVMNFKRWNRKWLVDTNPLLNDVHQRIQDSLECLEALGLVFGRVLGSPTFDWTSFDKCRWKGFCKRFPRSRPLLSEVMSMHCIICTHFLSS